MRLILLFCLSSLSLLQAQLLPEALGTFPADTTALEYDNLSALRKLPNYQELRQQYSSDALRRVKQTFLLLGIPEDQLSQVVTASGPNGFFGLVEGNFQAKTATKKAIEQNFSRATLHGGSALCSPNAVCIFFPDQHPGSAAFGNLEQLRAMLGVSAGHSPAINTDHSFTKLLTGLDDRAPVIGIAPGSEIRELLKNVAPQALSSRFDLSQMLPAIEGVGYGVEIDTNAHLTINLLCSSQAESKLLTSTLNAASNLQRMAAFATNDSLPFRNLIATPAGSMVRLRLDAKLIP